MNRDQRARNLAEKLQDCVDAVCLDSGLERMVMDAHGIELIEAFRTEIRREAMEKAACIASAPQGTALECLSGMPAQFQLGHKQAREEAAAAIRSMEANDSVVAIDLDSEATRRVFSNALLYNGIGSESECDELALAILATFRTINQ